MLIHAFSPIKKGAEEQIKKIYLLIVPVVIAVFLMAFFVVRVRLLSALVISLMCFWGLWILSIRSRW